MTAVIKVRNEAHQLADAIRSARLVATAIIVVDDGSTDGSADVARSNGARVIAGLRHGGRIDLLDKQGFSEVSSGWILRMDADERVTEELAASMKDAMASKSVAGVAYARLNHMFGDFVRWGGWFEPHQLGLFRAQSWDRTWDGGIHSQVPISGATHVIDPVMGWMIHLDYDTVESFVQRTLNRYAAAEAHEMEQRGIRFRRRRILVDPFLRVWGRYFLRRGYRDGHRGLVLAGLLGAYDITRWSMLWERTRDAES